VLTADSVVLGLVLFFASWGAVTGAARQLGQLGAIFLSYVGLRYGAPYLTTPVAKAMDISVPAARIMASALVFVTVVFVGRALLTRMMEGLLIGRDAKSRAPDRWLGFLLGGLKGAAGCYAVLACIVYAQETWSFGQKRLQLVSRKSVTYQWVKEHDALFETESVQVPPAAKR
jgi:uncharacterized membrane protein required for colicin V production